MVTMPCLRRAFFMPVTIALLPATWLIYHAKLPWLGFAGNAASSLIVLLAATQLLLRRGESNSIPQKNAAVFAVGPIFALIFSLATFFTQGSIDRALLACWFLLVFGYSVWLGARAFNTINIIESEKSFLSKLKKAPAIDLFFLSIVCVSAINVVFQISQWTGIHDIFGGMVRAPLSGGQRPFSNFGQPNLLATTLVWGITGTLWLKHRGYFSCSCTWVLGSFLAVGLGLTQSRTGALSIVFISLLSMVLISQRSLSIKLLFWATLAIIVGIFSPKFLQLMTELWRANELNESLQSADFTSTSSFKARIEVWKELAGSLIRQPFWGSGLNTSGLRHLETYSADLPTSHPVLFVYAHNVFLDFAIWFGLFPTAVIFSFFILMTVRFFTKARSTDQLLLGLFLVPFFVHTALELPHAYLSLLTITGLVLGALLRSKSPIVFSSSASRWSSTFINRPRRSVAGIAAISLLLAVCLLGAALVTDYVRLRQAFIALQFEARFRTPPPESELHPDFFSSTRLGPLVTA